MHSNIVYQLFCLSTFARCCQFLCSRELVFAIWLAFSQLLLTMQLLLNILIALLTMLVYFHIQEVTFCGKHCLLKIHFIKQLWLLTNRKYNHNLRIDCYKNYWFAVFVNFRFTLFLSNALPYLKLWLAQQTES